ncbi:GNAT family N-acetyltransferase [Pseudoalteromonas spongiae]|uniref:GNAT family N-acetyltransferase n=1 Tax=Pseudoalteromonas spongiae TaxID=298657 RepID=UPI000C2CE50B|nr:GNAT family N-acetyltransferase [Pseudoalteromonas spongiae]
MFTLAVDNTLELALIDAKFATAYFDIVTKQRDYLSRWLIWPSHADSIAFFSNFITRSLIDYANGKSLVCAMIYQGELVGNVSFNSIDRTLKKVEIGYWLSCDFQGKGIVTRAVTKLIELAFTQYEMEKVEIAVAVNNTASRNVCERLGFSLEGVITRAENLNGKIVDHAIYGLKRGS